MIRIIVLLYYVLVDGTRLPQSQIGVGILDGRHATIWIDVGKGLLLDTVKTKGLDLVVESEFFEYEDRLRGRSCQRRFCVGR